MERRRVYSGIETWMIHDKSQCAGGFCIFHNPSRHGLENWPMNLRETGLVERMCRHGIGHPDPDSAAWMDRRYGHEAGTWSIHGCDGCCYEGGDPLT